MNSLSKEILEIATRIKELREICDVSEEELANEVGVSLEQYRAYESGSDDIPVGVIYAVSRVLGVDSTAIITGSDA